MDIKFNPGSAPPQAENLNQQDAASAVNQSSSQVSQDSDGLVNYPEFTSALLEGTFQGVVDSSIEQMNDYAGLVKNVATPTEPFDPDRLEFTSTEEHISLTKDDDNK